MDKNDILSDLNENNKTQLLTIMKVISIDTLIEMWLMGKEDAENESWNLEYSTNKKVRCFGQVVEELYNKYCI